MLVRDLGFFLFSCKWMMQAPVDCWIKMEGYKKVAAIVKSMEVVNDCAERGVKRMSDFKDLTGDAD